MELASIQAIAKTSAKVLICILVATLTIRAAPQVRENNWLQDSADSLRDQKLQLPPGESDMGQTLAESLNYLKLIQADKFPKLIYEFGFAYGATLPDLSKTDLEQNIADNSLSLGLGLPVKLLKPQHGHVDFVTHVNLSRYTGAGNGTALSPIADLSYTTPEIIAAFAVYGGLGVGLGRDSMHLAGYTNEYKWTIDFFAGLQYSLRSNLYLRMGPLLRHKSHSFVGPWQGQGENIGYNGLLFEATMRVTNL